ncbi:MAG: EutN/CcmL family microcompartment protein [Clostridiales bacterium]|jgi:ethanolamine utilization protein EutN|nr:EutN/CcmL family microcompartment protein [Clostridiales bacterium]
MYAARVIGTVVCTTKDEKLSGRKMQVVQPVNLLTLKDEGKPAVAIDTVGAGISEIVLVVGGSSARQTNLTLNTPVDAVIMAIVDYIDIEGNRVYDKHKGKAGI